MTTGAPRKADFFISYTRADSAWAEWTAKVLEDAGHTVVVQFLDFAVGDNFVLAMERALAGSQRLVLLLSQAYMRSGFTAAEWSAVFRLDPDGRRRLLVPLLVEDFELDGLLGPRIHIPLHDVDEATARRRLLDGLQDPRATRNPDPPFPGRS